MSIERTEITNISNNQIQIFTIEDYQMRLEFSVNLQRWLVSIVGVIENRILAPNTDILSEYNLGFYLLAESDDDTGAATLDAFLSTGNSKLYILREVDDE